MVAASLHRARFCWACRVVALEAAEPDYLHPRQLSDHCNKQVLWKKLNLLFFPRIAMTLMLILTVRSKGINHICLHTENIGTVDSKLLALMFYILIFLLFNLFFFPWELASQSPSTAKSIAFALEHFHSTEICVSAGWQWQLWMYCALLYLSSILHGKGMYICMCMCMCICMAWISHDPFSARSLFS